MKHFLISNPTRQTRWITWAWLAACYLAGLILWGYFFSWGKFTLTFIDWAEITGPRLAFLRNALVQGLPPLHISNSLTLGSITDRFLAIPDQILSPQVILLRYLPIGSIGRFIAGNILLLYSLGYIGLLWLGRKFSLSPLAFLILFLLFNFNGHILAHLTVGHATWGGYFLFPWFVILVFQLVEGERGWTWITKMALLMLVIFLQGSFHQFVWALIFLTLLALAKREYFLTAGGGALFAMLLSLVRILPALSLMGKFNIKFVSGYPTLTDLWQSLFTIYAPGSETISLLMIRGLGYWEVSLYVGLVGVVFLAYFGVWRWLKVDTEQQARYHSLALPVLGLVVISIGQIYNLFRLMPIPLFDGERVSTRIISLPFVFILTFAVVHFQEWLDRPHRNLSLIYLVSGTVLIISLNDLWQNYRTWRLAAAARLFDEEIFDPRAWVVANHPDPVYTGLILAGISFSLVSLGLLLFFTWRSHRRFR